MVDDTQDRHRAFIELCNNIYLLGYANALQKISAVKNTDEFKDLKVQVAAADSDEVSAVRSAMKGVVLSLSGKLVEKGQNDARAVLGNALAHMQKGYLTDEEKPVEKQFPPSIITQLLADTYRNTEVNRSECSIEQKGSIGGGYIVYKFSYNQELPLLEREGGISGKMAESIKKAHAQIAADMDTEQYRGVSGLAKLQNTLGISKGRSGGR